LDVLPRCLPGLTEEKDCLRISGLRTRFVTPELANTRSIASHWIEISDKARGEPFIWQRKDLNVALYATDRWEAPSSIGNTEVLQDGWFICTVRGSDVKAYSV